MKKYKGLIIALAALIVVAGGFAIIRAFVPEEDTGTKDTQTSAKAETIYLVDMMTTDVNRIKFEFADGYQYSILGVTSTNENGNVVRNYLIEGKTQYDFDRSLLGNAMMALSSVAVSSVAEENPNDIARYGFTDEPSTVKVTVTDNSGVSYTILVGDPTPVGNYYYAMLKGRPEVFVIDSYYCKYLTAKDFYYRTLSVTAYEDPSVDIRAIRLSYPGRDTVEIYSRTPDEITSASDAIVSQFHITSPVEKECNDDAVSESLLVPIQTITAEAVLEDSLDNAQQYGLGEDARVVEIEHFDGTTRKFTVSPAQPDGYAYLIIGGVESVYRVQASAFAFADVEYKTLMRSLIWLHNITNVRRVEMTLAGSAHVLEVHVPTEDESAAGDVFSGTLDGEAVEEMNAKRLFIRVLSPTFYDFTDAENDEAEEITYELKIIYDDGREFSLSFAKLDDRRYLVCENGEQLDYFVNVNSLKAIGEAITIIKSGETLEG